METREEENGGKNNPPNPKEDHDTHNTPDLGNSESDETGLDPAEDTGENGTAVVSNGKTDDNQDKKDISQESPEQSDNNPAPDAAEHDTVPPGVQVKTDTSKSRHGSGPGSSSNVSEQTDNPPTQDGTVDAKIRSEAANKTVSPTSSDSGCSPLGPKPGLDQDTRRPADAPLVDHKEPVANKREVNATQNSDSSSKGTEPKTEEEAKQNTERGDCDDPDSVEASDLSLYDGTSASDTPEQNQNLDAGQEPTPDLPEEASRTMSSENGRTAKPLPTTDSSVEALKLKANEINEAMKESPATEDDNGASQHEGGEEFHDADDTKSLTTSGKADVLSKNAIIDQPNNPVNEPMKEHQATGDDNGASQHEGGEEFHDADDTKSLTTSGKTDVLSKNAIIDQPNNPGDNRAPPPENKQSGSKNLQSGSRSPVPGGKLEEEKEARKRDANGRSEAEMKTGSGANKDDDEEGQPKKRKAKGEGVKGEGGTEDAVKPEERVVKERPVSISLCTSAYRFNVEGLVSYLKDLKKEHPKLIKAVKVHELPYNDLDHYRFDEKDPVDVMILCHSINNRRFAITDVMDALYDEYLPYCARVIGKEKMGVIVHDFDDMRETVQSSRMSSFKYKQPKAFETTSLQITCGHIEKEGQVLKQMRKADRDKIVGFLERASKYPEEMQKEETKWTESLKRFIPNFSGIKSYVGFGSSGKANEGQIEESIALRSMGSNIPTAEREQKNQDSSNEGTSVDPQPAKGNTEPDPPRDSSPATQQSPGAVHATAAPGTQVAIDLPSQQKKTQNSGKGFTSVPQSPSRTPRRISVSVCSSAYEHNVKGLMSWFTKFQAKQPHMITDVVFRELPYNDIDSFRFPPNDPVDVMVLCHSVENRGFSITNVVNALYEKYLKYCNKLIGKKKLAVIVHDFADCKPAIVEGRMESFRRMQPLTFELVETVIICGRLEDSDKLGIREEDLTRLICFLELARFEPKENFKQSMFGKLF